MSEDWKQQRKQDILQLIEQQKLLREGAKNLKEALLLKDEQSNIVLQKAEKTITVLNEMLENLDTVDECDEYNQILFSSRPLKVYVDAVVSTKLEEYYKKLVEKERFMLDGLYKIEHANNMSKGSLSDKIFRENIRASKSKILKYEMILKQEAVEQLKNRIEEERKNEGLLDTTKKYQKYNIPKLFERNPILLEYRITVQRKLLDGCLKLIELATNKKIKEKMKGAERNISERLDLLLTSFKSFHLNREPNPVEIYMTTEFEISGTFYLKVFGFTDLQKSSEMKHKNNTPRTSKVGSTISRLANRKSLMEENVDLVCGRIYIDNRLITCTPWIPQGVNPTAITEEARVSLEMSRQLTVEVVNKNYRSLCAIGFLPICEFIDGRAHYVQMPLEPCGFAMLSARYEEPKEHFVNLKRGRHVFIREKTDCKSKNAQIPGIPSFEFEQKVKIQPRLSTHDAMNSQMEHSPGASFEDTSGHEESSELEENIIHLRQFTVMRLIGRGCFGAVFRVRHNISGREAAMKVVSKADVLRENEAENFMVERNVLLEVSRSNHPFFVTMYGCIQDTCCLYFFMPLMKGGDIFCYVLENIITREVVPFYASCVILALEFLHSKNIMYRDLKLENIMMDTDGYAKLADFGLCKMNMGETDCATSFCGTPSFMAPEIISKKPYTRMVDWWSFGVLLYELYFQLDPFERGDECIQAIFRNILFEEVEYPSDSDPILVNLIKLLLKKNPNERLGCGKDGVNKIKYHAYFSDIQFDKLLNKEIEAPIILDKGRIENDLYFDQTLTSKSPIVSAEVKQDLIAEKDQEHFKNFDAILDSLAQ